MEREILFRGKSVKNGQWYYGSLDIRHEPTLYYIRVHYGQANGFGAVLSEIVDPKTVGQYIGRKDKECNKLFEGNICHDRSKNIVVIRYDEDLTQFAAFPTTSVLYAFSQDYGNMIKIGNIHDNPELRWKTLEE